MRNKLLVMFEIKNPKLISVNDQYIHPVRKCKDGRYRSYVVKAPYLKEVQEYYKEVLPELIPDEIVKEIQSEINKTSNYGLSLEFMVGIPEKEFYDHDISNFIKALEDCIFTYLGVDDCYDTRVVASKRKCKDSSDWSLLVTLWKIIIPTDRPTQNQQTVLTVEGSEEGTDENERSYENGVQTSVEGAQH